MFLYFWHHVYFDFIQDEEPQSYEECEKGIEKLQKVIFFISMSGIEDKE